MQLLVHAARAFAATVVVVTAAFAASVGSAEARSQIYAPRNDNFAAAFPLTSSPRLQPGHIYYSSRQLGEPKLLPSSRGRTVWYTYTATVTGRAVVALTTGSMDRAPLQLGVYRGTALAALVKLGTAQLAGTGTQTAGAVAFDTVKGTVYKIQVDTAPQSYFEGNFQIGLAEHGTAGGLPAFVERPTIIQEETYESRSILVVNGFRKKVNLQYGISNINEYLTVTNTGVTLDVGATTWYTIEDNRSIDLPTVGSRGGTMIFTARDFATNQVLGTGQTPVYAIRPDYVNESNVLVRFERPAVGTRATEFIASRVVVRNNSAVRAVGCRFYGGEDAFDPSFSQVLSNGSVTATNVPFDLAPGQSRTYVARFAGSTDNNYDVMALDCGNYYGDISSDILSSFVGAQQFGMASRVIATPIGANALMQVGIPDFNAKTVVMTVTNTGEYAGEFQIDVEDEEYLTRADVTSFCVSTKAGVCIQTPATSQTYVDLAVGEVAYVALTVNRGNDTTGTGFVYVEFRSTESPETRFAGRGGFQVIRQP